jgi:hypothetical protein
MGGTLVEWCACVVVAQGASGPWQPANHCGSVATTVPVGRGIVAPICFCAAGFTHFAVMG